jgi:hypothetical protein
MKSTRKASKPQKKLSPLTGSRDMNHKTTKLMPAANLTKKPISDRQPLSACGQLRCPRFMEIPVTKKVYIFNNLQNLNTIRAFLKYNLYKLDVKITMYSSYHYRN